MEFNHYSVLLQECIDALNIDPNGIYVDGTLGGGGHSAEILRRLNGTGHLYGIDRDNDALAAATERLGAAGNFTAVKGNFHDVKALLAARGVTKIDGMMIDLGVSSYQLDTAERGFSYHADAPLDMRILLNTESKDFHFEGLNIECVHSSAATYGERMTDALRRVKTEYTLLMLDDFFLREPVKMDRLHDLVRWMDADRDIVYFSSDITEALYDWEVDRYPGYRRLPVGNRYTLNMQAAVWRTDKFAEYWNHKVSPWDWEERCNVLTAAHPKDKFYCVLNEEARFLNYGYHKGQWMGICHGKWVEHDVVPFFAKEGIEIDYAKRGFVDLAHRPASLQKETARSERYDLVRRCLGAGYLLPYFLFCRRCNLYSKKNHCAVDEDYFHYLQRKADLQSQTGKKCLFGPMQR